MFNQEIDAVCFRVYRRNFTSQTSDFKNRSVRHV